MNVWALPADVTLSPIPVAVPVAKKDTRRLAYRIAKDYLKIGVLEVEYTVFESVSAPIMREYHKTSKKKMAHLHEEHKTYLEAGSNGGGYYTPYLATMDKVKSYILDHPGCTLKDIMAYLDSHHHYASNATAKSTIRNALISWEKNWCHVDISEKEFRYRVKK